MADPISIAGAGVSLLGKAAPFIGIGASVAGGAAGMKAAGIQAQAQKLQIQGSIMQTMAKAFGMEVEASQYEYAANVAKYRAAVAKINADIAKQNATYERDVGEISAQQSGMKSRAELGAMKAQQGASGIAINSDTATHVRESMIELGMYDQMMIRSNAARRAYGFEAEATQDLAQADLYRYESGMQLAQKENALTAAGMTRETIPLQRQAMSLAGQAGALGAQTSMINMVGSVASKWMQGKQLGMFE